ncbi:MAG: TonB-dependent receptor [Bacteroidia bacterium]|nr:TonB-dependent receptor [Bacteroidia bacterium]
MRSFIIVFALLLSFSLAFSQTGLITGQVFDAYTNQPLPFVKITVDGTEFGALSDSAGNFSIEIKPGFYNVTANLEGYKPLTDFEVQVTRIRPGVIAFSLEMAEVQLGDVEIKADPFSKTEESPVSIRSLGRNEIQRNPGGNRDISRVLQTLPGVGTGSTFRNDMSVRGGNPSENRFYLDGIEVPHISHFVTLGSSGGAVGMVNVDAIQSADLYSGAFPANRYNALSSVVEIKQRRGRADRLGFTGTVGSSDIGMTLEGPIGKKTTFMVSGRHSYLQFLFKGIGLPYLPTYDDYQFKVDTKIDSRNELTVLGIGAYDNFVLNLEADSTDEQRYYLDNLDIIKQTNYTVGARYRHFADNGYWTFVVSRNFLRHKQFKYMNNDESDPANLVFDYLSHESENKMRAEHRLIKGGFKINYGLNYEYAQFRTNAFQVFNDTLGTYSTNVAGLVGLHKYGFFTQASRKFVDDKISLSLGVRFDGNSYSNLMNNPLKQFSPRFAFSWQFIPKLYFNFSSGLYYQLPSYTLMGYQDGSGNLANQAYLKYIRNANVIGGFEYQYSPTGKIMVEGSFKDYSNYPLLTNNSIAFANQGMNFGIVGNEPAASTARGRAWSLEFMAQQRLWKGFFGTVALTLVNSEFTNGDGKYTPSQWNNKHILVVTMGKKFKGNWEIGAKWRHLGGFPYTPFNLQQSAQIAVWDINRVGILDYSQINTLRTADFHALDLRIDKKFYFKKWSLNCYIDVQNLYNFSQDLPPFFDPVRDSEGKPIPDPQNPGSYQYRVVPNNTGHVQPTVGIVVQI